MYGKRGGESLNRAPTTPAFFRKAHSARERREASSLSYTALNSAHPLELPPLYYFEISIQGKPLRALVDSGSNRTILGADGIKIVRQLKISTREDQITRICTGNGQLAEVREEAEISLALENQHRVISACLLPNLTVSCIVGMDFLCKFGIGLDFASSEWYFANNPTVRYSFETQNETLTTLRVQWTP